MKDKKVIVIIGIVLLAILLILGSVVIWYTSSIKSVNKNDEKIEITIPMGTGTSGIADILKDNKLIKSKTAFKLYVKLNKVTNFQAGKYYLKQNMNLKEITNMLKTGILEDPNQITITYLEGKNIRWLASKIAEITNNTEEDLYSVLSDEEYLDSLIEKYWFISEDIKDKNIYYSLEGYLFPDTYALENKDVKVQDIIEKMLDRMQDILEDYKDLIEQKDYKVHKILTVASIIEMESMNEEGRKDVSSVIYNRLAKNMAIQSDVTTYYAAKVDVGERDLYQAELDQYNEYNTRGPNMEGKLPIGPISSVSKNSIDAALKPNNTDYLFFVADKNGKLYFTKTVEEHNSIVSELKSQGLWLEY